MDNINNENRLPDIPNEIYSEIFSYLELKDVRKAREVSKKWKSIVPNARPYLHFVCQLTDETFTFAVTSEEIFSRLEVHDFSGNGKEVVSPTNGTGLLFANMQSIKFSGNNIAPGEIPKMMQFAVGSIKMLEFQSCGIDTLRPFIEVKQTFNALHELSFTYPQFPTVNDTLALEGFAAPELGPVLPSLTRLKIFLDNPDTSRPSTRDMFLNYLAIVKLIVKYMRSLKDVEIQRTPMFRSITHDAISHQFDSHDVFVLNSPTLNTQFQQCLRAFPEMTLEKLHISPENARHPWVLETRLLARQKSLKEVVIEELIEYMSELPNLTTLLPANHTSLTSVKITFQYHRNSGPVDLEAFNACPNLKTLWLVLFQGWSRNGDDPIWNCTSEFSNVETLPKGISSLRLKCDNQKVDVNGRRWKHQLIILTLGQVNWIINNLKDLESLWVQLVIGNSQRPLDELDANKRPNLTLEMFKNLISLPNLKNLKLDLLKVEQLESNFHDLEEEYMEDPDKEFDVFVISPGEIQDYIDVCKSQPNVSYVVSHYPVHIQGRHVRFLELTIHSSNST